MSSLKKNNFQKKLAEWIGRKSNRLPLRTKKAMLLCIVCTVGIYCSLKIVSVFEQNESPEKDAGSRVSISIPEHTRQQSDSRINFRTDRDKAILERIHRYYLYLDSLSQSPSGHGFYDSLVHARPGLPDSLLMIENIYQSLQKK